MALLALLIDLYSLIVFVWVILSWVRLSEDNPLVRITNALVEPLVAPGLADHEGVDEQQRHHADHTAEHGVVRSDYRVLHDVADP